MNPTPTQVVTAPDTLTRFDMRWVFAVWVATAMLFAHGCHGPDEDHELSWLPPNIDTMSESGR